MILFVVYHDSDDENPVGIYSSERKADRAIANQIKADMDDENLRPKEWKTAEEFYTKTFNLDEANDL